MNRNMNKGLTKNPGLTKSSNKNVAELVALDSGKFNVKGYCRNRHIIFKNRVSEGHSDVLSEGSYNAVFKKGKYFVGNSASGVNAIEGKAEFENLLTTLVAITQLTDKNEIILVYGESVNFYFDEEHHKKLKKLLKGTHTIEVQGELREITIKEVYIFLEGIGHMFTNYEENGVGTRVTVDIGGTTMQVFVTTNGAPSEKHSYAFHMGMYSIRSQVREKFKRLLKRPLTANEVEEYIDKVCARKNLQAKIDRGVALTDKELVIYERSLLKNPKMIEIIESVIREQLKELDRELAEINNFSLKTREEVFFVGGTSVQIGEYIKEHYSEDDVYINVLEDGLLSTVKGYYAYGLIINKANEVR